MKMKRKGENVIVKKGVFLTACRKIQPVPDPLRAPARGGSAAARWLRPRAAGVPDRECSPWLKAGMVEEPAPPCGKKCVRLRGVCSAGSADAEPSCWKCALQLPCAPAQLSRAQDSAARSFPHRHSGHSGLRAGQGQAAGKGGRWQGERPLVSASHFSGRSARVACSPLWLYIRRRERGRKRTSLRRVWEGLQAGRGWTLQRGAEELQGTSAGPSGGTGTLRASVTYFIYIYFLRFR